jgi:hypothetical protein
MLNISGVANSRVIDAIAAAAGVSRSSVVITGIFHGTPGRRRLMLKDTAPHPTLNPLINSDTVKTVRIWATIHGTSHINDAMVTTLLDPYIVDSFSWIHSHTVRVSKV